MLDNFLIMIIAPKYTQNNSYQYLFGIYIYFVKKKKNWIEKYNNMKIPLSTILFIGREHLNTRHGVQHSIQ